MILHFWDNITLIYLIILIWKLGLGLGLTYSCTILAFFTENNKTSTLSSANFTERNILLKEHTRTINDKTKLHIQGVSVNKLWQLVNCVKLYSIRRAIHL